MTPTERKALLFLCFILLISFIIRWIKPHIVETKIYDYTMQDSLFRIYSADTLIPERQNDGRGQKKKKAKKVLLKKSINVNTADSEELERLPRIGKATAKLIIEYRQRNNGFKSLEELTKIKRIGPKTLEKIEPFIYLQSDSVRSVSY